MGFLDVGEPYEWSESRENGILEYIRAHGIEQFKAIWDKVKGIDNDELKWGDEIEYGIFVHDPTTGEVRCSLRGAEILAELNQREATAAVDDGSGSSTLADGCNWVPEYGSWMVEGTPNKPYSAYAADLVTVERNMRLRRARLLAVLKPNEICPTIPCFPRLGVGQFTQPPAQCASARSQPHRPRQRYAHACAPFSDDGGRTSLRVRRPNGPIAASLFIPDEAINPHPRFGALTRNIRRRRSSNVDIRMPRYVDTATPPARFPAGCPPPQSAADADGMDEVYMDAMAFGMGCCCLQVCVHPPPHEPTAPMHSRGDEQRIAPPGTEWVHWHHRTCVPLWHVWWHASLQRGL